MRFTLALLLGCLLFPPVAMAQTPTGDWLVENGEAVIRIVDCGDTLWGVVAWQKRPGGRDLHNPKPSLRNRPTLGIPVLLHMRRGEDAGSWEGEVYNAKDGKTYDATITLRDADTLNVEGCALAILCGDEDWKRVTTTASVATGSAVSESPANICSRIPGVSGRSH